MRIWLIHMDQFEGSHFEIIGFSEDNNVLVKIERNISPYAADQKVFKSPYE